MTDHEIQLKCSEMMDEKVKPLYDKKLDKWLYIPTFILFLTLLGITFGIAINNATGKDIERVENEVKKYDGMELRIVNLINSNQEKILNKIEEIKK